MHFTISNHAGPVATVACSKFKGPAVGSAPTVQDGCGVQAVLAAHACRKVALIYERYGPPAASPALCCLTYSRTGTVGTELP